MIDTTAPSITEADAFLIKGVSCDFVALRIYSDQSCATFMIETKEELCKLLTATEKAINLLSMVN